MTTEPADIARGGITDRPELVAARLAEVLPQVEAALTTASLEQCIADPALREVLGETVSARYRSVASENLQHDPEFRRVWIAAFLDLFRLSVQQPRSAFPAEEFRADPKSKSWRPSQNTLPLLRVNHFQGEVILRPDQVIAARRWAIWFEFADDRLGHAYAAYLVEMARNRLASHIKYLWNVEATHLAGKLHLSPDAKWGANHVGGRFERLMIDVLNEHGPHAKPASVAEDVLEWTDLRVHYASMPRKEGARVQVSLVAHPEHHQRKVQKVFRREEFVFLTPIDLAVCALEPPEHGALANFDWSDLWASLDGRPGDAPALAQLLHDIFAEALRQHPGSPLGPMWIIPVPVRRYIRAFTEHYAVESARQILERVASGREGVSSADRFTGTVWKEKFACRREANGSLSN